MPKLNKTAIKQGLKSTAKAAGILALSAGVGIGSFTLADRISRKKEFSKIPTEKVEIRTKDRLNSSDLSDYNRRSKITEIYFINGEKISRINLDVAKINQITRLMPDSVKTNVNKIIDNKIRKINQEIKVNPKLRKAIENRIGNGNYRQYLLSLPMERLEKVFTPQELKQIKAELNKIPVEKLKELHEKVNKTYEGTISIGFLVSLLLGAGLFEAAKKKTEDFNFH